MNRFEKSLERIKNVIPQDNRTEEDWEHYKTVIEALKLAAEVREHEVQFKRASAKTTA